MAINQQVDSNTLKNIENMLGGATSSDAKSLADILAGQANQALLSNTNYLNTLLQIQQSNASLQQNTASLQSDIADTNGQMADANYAARQKQGTTGAGNTGLGALQSVNTTTNNANTLAKIKNTATANATTRQTMDLRNANIQQSLLQTMGTILNQNVNQVDDYGDITLKDQNGQDHTFSKDVYGPDWTTLLDNTTDGMDPISEDNRKNAKNRAYE